MTAGSFALFPALLEPARAAALRIMREGLSECEVSDNPGFVVARQDRVAPDRRYGTFKCEGETFSLFVAEEV